MVLAEVEKKILNRVVHQFLDLKKPVQRKELVREFENPEAVDRLASVALLERTASNNYLPTGIAFQYCGDSEVQAMARRGVRAVAHVLRNLLREENPALAAADIERRTREFDNGIDEKTIRLGLYLAPEVGLISGFQGKNDQQVDVVPVTINEYIYNKNLENVWDDFIRQREPSTQPLDKVDDSVQDAGPAFASDHENDQASLKSQAKPVPLAQLLALRLIVETPSVKYQAMATLISPGSAVTPLHVIERSGMLRGAHRIAAFPCQGAAPKGIPAALVASDKATGFAVLRLDVPVQYVVPYDLVRAHPFPTKGKWESHFAFVGDEKGSFIEGELVDSSIAHPRLSLAQPIAAHELPGISGAPVIVENQLLGIVAEGDSDGRFLHTVTVTEMMESTETDAVRSLLPGSVFSSPPPSGKPEWSDRPTIDRFSIGALTLLSRANQISEFYKSNMIHMKHLLFALREEPDSTLAGLCTAQNVDLALIIDPGSPLPVIPSINDKPPEPKSFPSMSDNVRRALTIAARKAAGDSQQSIGLNHVLFGVLSTTENARVRALNDGGVTPDKLMAAMSEIQLGPSTHVARDRWTTEDTLGHFPYAYAIYRFLTDNSTQPPLAISIQAPWGGGKSSLMRMIQSQLDPVAVREVEQANPRGYSRQENARVKDVLYELDSSGTRSKEKKAQLDGPQNAKLRFEIPPIEGGDRRRVTIWFNAWKYDSTAQIWAGLADCIVQQIGERLGPVERELFWFQLQLRRIDAARIRRKIYEEVFSVFIGKVMHWLWTYILASLVALISVLSTATGIYRWWGLSGFLVALFAVLLSLLKQGKSAKSKVDEKPARTSLGDVVQAPDYRASLGFVHEVVEDLKKVFEIIPSKHLPMIVFIDDLDRCSPGKVADVVEAINLFLAGEFPHCMFILGIDDEMVAAALDKAHGDVIAKLPSYAKSTSIGWRFMDKFVQLPFIIPPSTKEDLKRYTESLLSLDGENADLGIAIRDQAAQLVEESRNLTPAPEVVVEKVNARQQLTNSQRQTLRKDVEAIQEMSRNIDRFSDQEKSVQELILNSAVEYSSNPRDVKRFVNMFRFYYFLRAARQGRKEPVPSLEQMCRWIDLSLRWPEVVRWLRRRSSGRTLSAGASLAALENVGRLPPDLGDWQEQAKKCVGFNVSEASWLSDQNLLKFFQREASYPKGERLSSCAGMGIW